MMERKKMMQRSAVWVSGIMLMSIGLFLYLENPLDVPFDNLLSALLIWPIIFGIVDFLFRNNEVYRKTMLMVKLFILIAFYFVNM